MSNYPYPTPTETETETPTPTPTPTPSETPTTTPTPTPTPTAVATSTPVVEVGTVATPPELAATGGSDALLFLAAVLIMVGLVIALARRQR